MILEIRATKEQVEEMATVLVNSSLPVGMGFHKFINKIYTNEEVGKHVSESGFDFDYFDGRQVKMSARRMYENVFHLGHDRGIEYQSWQNKFSIEHLLESLGITDIKKIEDY